MMAVRAWLGLLAWGVLLGLLLVWLAVVRQWVGRAPEEPPAALQRRDEKVWLGCTLTVVVLADDVLATVEVENTSAHPLKFFKRWLPPDGALMNDKFWIERDGLRAPYRGEVEKPILPTPADWLTLQPGDTITATVPLRHRYDVMTPGEYVVWYYSAYFPPDAHESVYLNSNRVSFERR